MLIGLCFALIACSVLISVSDLHQLPLSQAIDRSAKVTARTHAKPQNPSLHILLVCAKTIALYVGRTISSLEVRTLNRARQYRTIEGHVTTPVVTSEDE
jgi:hypothetical protein